METCTHCSKVAQLKDNDLPYCVPHYYEFTTFGQQLLDQRRRKQERLAPVFARIGTARVL